MPLYKLKNIYYTYNSNKFLNVPLKLAVFNKVMLRIRILQLNLHLCLYMQSLRSHLSFNLISTAYLEILIKNASRPEAGYERGEGGPRPAGVRVTNALINKGPSILIYEVPRVPEPGGARNNDCNALGARGGSCGGSHSPRSSLTHTTRYFARPLRLLLYTNKDIFN